MTTIEAMQHLHLRKAGDAPNGVALPPLLLGLLLVVVALVYLPGLGGGFVFDDFHNIVNNPYLRIANSGWRDWVVASFSAEAGPLQRPLAMLSFAANIQGTGMDPWPMKVTNLAIHLANTVLVYALCAQVFRTVSRTGDPLQDRAKWAALAAAGCWALHPINLMSVLYVVQRMESLCHTFVFAGLWLYMLGRHRQLEGRSGWHLVAGGVIGGTVLGAMSKESAVLLPLYAAAIEGCLLHFRGSMHGDGRVDRRLVLFFIVVLVIPAITAVSLLLPAMLAPGAYAIRDFTMSERLLTEARVVLEYLQWSLVPNLNQLSLYHDDYVISRGLLAPPATLVSVIAIPVILLVAWKARKARPIAVLGIAWFFSAHLLTGTFIPLELVYEHRNYFASLGAILVVVDLLLDAPQTESARRTGAAAMAACLLVLASLTFLRASEWSHPLRFAITEAAKHPNSPRATYDLARNLVLLTNYDPASPFLKDAWVALERARDVEGSNILPNQAALMLAARTRSPQDRIWWQDMQDKLRTQTMGAANLSALIALNNCAVENECTFDPENMLATFSAALRDKPEAGVLSIYGKYALYVLHDHKLALELWREAAITGSNNPQFRANLAMLLIDLGRYDEARTEILALRKLSRLGVFDRTAAQLEQRMASAQRAGTRADAEGGPSRP